jgi:hypothetical protein
MLKRSIKYIKVFGVSYWNWHGLEPDTSSTKSGTLFVHHSGWYEGRTLCGFNVFGFPTPLQRREEIGFSTQRIRKYFTSGFEFVFPSALTLAQLILCHGIYCALCLGRSSRQRVKNASIGPGVRKEKSIQCYDGRHYVTARQARWTCYTT